MHGNKMLIMGKKKKKNKNVVSTPSSPKNGVENKGGKLSKAREAIRSEIRLILAAAGEKNLIEKTTSTVKKVRSFTTDDILNFISDVKVKTREEVKKIGTPKNKIPEKDLNDNFEYKPTKVKVSELTQEQKVSTSYYDRWYNLVVNKGQKPLNEKDL